MASCEKSRTKAYSNDLRWRMVWHHEAMEKSVGDIPQSLCVDKSTVYRTIKLFHQTGEVQPKAYPKEKSFRKLISPAQLLILQLVIDRPGIYLREIQTELLNVLAISIDVSAVCKFLSKIGFTRQKLQILEHHSKMNSCGSDLCQMYLCLHQIC